MFVASTTQNSMNGVLTTSILKPQNAPVLRNIVNGEKEDAALKSAQLKDMKLKIVSQTE